MKTGRVYKIITTEGNECYVGSTFNTTRDRFRMHKDNFKKNDKGVVCSVFKMFDKYGMDKCKMVLIKEYEVVDRRHLEVYETLWIKKLKAINKLQPCGGILRKEQQRQIGKKWRDENNEQIVERTKQYYEDNKEIIAERQKQYYEDNKEIIAEREKRYREKNRDIIREKAKEKITCECGSIIRKDSLSKHKRSIKHKAFTESQ